MSGPQVSVVVCTWERPDELRRVLRSLADQTLPRHRFEVIVVDNGGSVEELARSEGADLVLFEETPGNSRARNRGWQRAAADLVAFIDDDAEATPEWLETAVQLYANSGDRVAVIGGLIVPLWDGARPSWFKDEYERRSWGHDQRLLKPGESLSASNMFFTRQTLQRLNGFDVRLGAVGGRLLLGEETELFHRLWTDDPLAVVVYTPRLVVRHSVPRRKMTVRYQLHRAAVWGESYILQRRLPLWQRLAAILENAWAFTRVSLRALTTVRLPIQQWAVEDLQDPAKHWGMIKGALRGH